MPSVGCSEPGGGGGGGGGGVGGCSLSAFLAFKTLCTLKWKCLKGQGGREERVCRKEGKGSRQRGGHPFPFSLALLLVSLWMIPRNSHLAPPPPPPPRFTTPHRWHRVHLRPPNHLHRALFLEIGVQAKISQAMQAPRQSLCAAQGMEGVFQPRCSFTPNQVFQCLLSLQRPLYSVSLPLLHTVFTRHTSKYRHTTSTYPQLFCSNTCLVHRSNTLKLDDSRICLFVCLLRNNCFVFSCP